MKILHSILWCVSLSWKASKWYTVMRVLAGAVAPLFTILTAFVGKHIIDLLAGQSEFYQQIAYFSQYTVLLAMLILLFAVTATRLIMQRLDQYCQAMHDDILNGRLAVIVMERSLYADLEYFDNPAYHDKLVAASGDSYGIVHIVWNVLNSLSALIACVFAFAVLSQVNVLFGVAMFFAALPASIVAARYTKLLYRLSLEQINGQRQMAYTQSVATDKFYAQDLRLFNAGGKLKQKYQQIWQNLFAVRRRSTRKRATFTGLLELLPECVLTWVAISISFQILAGNATVGDYSLYLGLSAQLWGAISMLSSSAINIYDNKMKIENFEAIENFQNHVLDSGTKRLEQVDTIAFSNVNFSYPGTNRQVLTDITFNLQKHQKVALVGLNGSGKSTLIKLLLRLYSPDSGTITINGVDISEYTLSSLRDNFSVYFQGMRNYNFTLRENFTIASGTADDTANSTADEDSQITAAIGLAGCADMLTKATKGLDTALTRYFDPSGIELSGGQHQKLALARTLFRKHTALILDEPSSNLDPKAEHDIFETLKEFSSGKLTIFTSHRLSNVYLADRIILLESGSIAEDGTQAELLSNPKRYAELYRYQQEKYQ
ncbi:MAG: ABC transporter ATP-binding protein/permease [Defluviitaleaceae bacterium]|nr:ABC transporter ATP-binding protein/permease [Defluviitaleaceae bacterium]